MNLSQSNSRNSGLKAIIVILLLLLLGSLAYTYKLQTETTEATTKLTSDKQKLQTELETKIAEYNTAIADNTALKGELEEEQAKMVELLEKLKKSEGDASSLAKFRVQFSQLKRDMNNLVAENNSLKERNTKLSKDLDSTSTELNVAKTLNDTLKNSNSKLAKTIEKGQKLALLNLQMLAVKQKSSGKQIPTDKASKADVLKVSFSIAENQIAKKGDRTFYVQIIDSKSNVLGDKKGENLNGNFLSYSFLKTIKYENKTTQIQEDLPVKNLKEGTFFVNVFDKEGNVVVKSSFDLK